MNTRSRLAHIHTAILIAGLSALVPMRALATSGAAEADPGYGLLVGALIFGIIGVLLLGLGVLASRRAPTQPSATQAQALDS